MIQSDFALAGKGTALAVRGLVLLEPGAVRVFSIRSNAQTLGLQLQALVKQVLSQVFG